MVVRCKAVNAMNYDTPQDLVNTFVNSSERLFLGLEKRYHLVRSLQAVVFGESGIQVVLPENIGNRFSLLELTLSGPLISFVITYGDRESHLSCKITCKHFEESYALWEWLDVLNKNDIKPEDSGGWVITSDRVNTVLTQIEYVLEHLLPIIASADRALEKQLTLKRNERAQIDQQLLADQEHAHLAVMAAEAFHRHDYAAVVKLLSSIQGLLTASEQAKLVYAQKKLMA